MPSLPKREARATYQQVKQPGAIFVSLAPKQVRRLFVCVEAMNQHRRGCARTDRVFMTPASSPNNCVSQVQTQCGEAVFIVRLFRRMRGGLCTKPGQWFRQYMHRVRHYCHWLWSLTQPAICVGATSTCLLYVFKKDFRQRFAWYVAFLLTW
jgi:hypothetical protein